MSMNLHIKGDLEEFELLQTPTKVTYKVLSLKTNDEKFEEYLNYLIGEGGNRWLYDHLKSLEEFISKQYNNVTWFAA